MREIAIHYIEDEFKRPKESVSYQYVRGLINMAYFLGHISGDDRSDLMSRAEKFIKQ